MSILDLHAIVSATAARLAAGDPPVDPFDLADAVRTRPAPGQPGTLPEMLSAVALYVGLPGAIRRRFGRAAWRHCLAAATADRRPTWQPSPAAIDAAPDEPQAADEPVGTVTIHTRRKARHARRTC